MASKSELALFALTALAMSFLAPNAPNNSSNEDAQNEERRASQSSQGSNASKPRSITMDPIPENVRAGLEVPDGDDNSSRRSSTRPSLGERRNSTFDWLLSYARDSFYQPSNRDRVLEIWPAQPTGDTSKRPINILCFDGGGAKGLTLKVVYEALENMLDAPLRDEFDLVAGTSIGGIAALFCNRFRKIGKVPKHACHFAKMITAGSLRAPAFMKIFRSGYMFNDNRAYLLQYILDKDRDILNDKKPKAFVVATTREECGDLQPFLMRTYEAPKEEEGGVVVAEGTCQVKVWEAAVATSAAPVAYDRIDVEVQDGEEVSLADGGLVANDPTELALYEAVALFPDHPIGLVLSIGCGRKDEPKDGIDDTACFPEIGDTVKLMGGEYYRFNPVVGKFSSMESNQDVLDEMEEKLQEYMEETDHAKEVKAILRKHAELRDHWDEQMHESRPCASAMFRSCALPQRTSTISNASSEYRKSLAARKSTASTADMTISSDTSAVPQLPDPEIFYRPSTGTTGASPTIAPSSASPGNQSHHSGGSTLPRRGRRPPPKLPGNDRGKNTTRSSFVGSSLGDASADLTARQAPVAVELMRPPASK